MLSFSHSHYELYICPDYLANSGYTFQNRIVLYKCFKTAVLTYGFLFSLLMLLIVFTKKVA